MLKDCCCGCSLRTGCFVLAYLNLIQLVANCITISIDPDYYLGTSAIKGGYIFAMILSILVGIDFVYGVHKENWKAIVPHLVVSVLMIAIIAIGSVIFAASGFPIFLILLLPCLLACYFTAVVWSYIVELKQRGKEGQPSIYTPPVVKPQAGSVAVQMTPNGQWIFNGQIPQSGQMPQKDQMPQNEQMPQNYQTPQNLQMPANAQIQQEPQTSNVPYGFAPGWVQSGEIPQNGQMPQNEQMLQNYQMPQPANAQIQQTPQTSNVPYGCSAPGWALENAGT